MQGRADVYADVYANVYDTRGMVPFHGRSPDKRRACRRIAAVHRTDVPFRAMRREDRPVLRSDESALSPSDLSETRYGANAPRPVPDSASTEVLNAQDR